MGVYVLWGGEVYGTAFRDLLKRKCGWKEECGDGVGVIVLVALLIWRGAWGVDFGWLLGGMDERSGAGQGGSLGQNDDPLE